MRALHLVILLFNFLFSTFAMAQQDDEPQVYVPYCYQLQGNVCGYDVPHGVKPPKTAEDVRKLMERVNQESGGNVNILGWYPLPKGPSLPIATAPAEESLLVAYFYIVQGVGHIDSKLLDHHSVPESAQGVFQIQAELAKITNTTTIVIGWSAIPSP